LIYSLASGPSSGTRRGRTRSLSVGPVTSQAARGTAAAATRAAHLAQDLAHRHAVAIAGAKRNDGVRPLASTARTAAINDQREAGQLA
jgi:hypothetical protein